ncbi:hypothetical protein PR048_006803 [Dryococelus australis]|uniref:Uncharacterized protein n=1 Tax=Dryococelus australis TaxID=614101 RepID=A0ABQ9IC06_9NEOP|nr:hypothetical protein PR048_006803 [Dryococelus australis]
MAASVHKILILGSDVMDDIILPIGQLSEDVQEARDKEYRLYWEHHTRKVSRESTNEDLLHSLLISSDPLISSDVLKLLTPPSVKVSVIDESLTESDNSIVLA